MLRDRFLIEIDLQSLRYSTNSPPFIQPECSGWYSKAPAIGLYPQPEEASSITNSMELSPSSEPTSCAANQEFTSILWNLKVHYRVHRSRINPVHTMLSYLR
jgi:hypothetical protein